MSVGMENVPPVYGAAPPDQQQETLEEHLDAVLAIIMKDGGMDQYEMRVLGAFFKTVSDFAQGAQAGIPGAEFEGGQTPGQMNGNSEDYMGNTGTPVEYGG